MTDLADVMRIYTGSDADATKRLYAELEGLGPIGIIAMNLFRAQKASERAKVYRGGGFRGKAYDKKQWSIDNVCGALLEHGVSLRWGWGLDEKQPVHCHVLYVDLPTGQVSFHTGARGEGPDYPAAWDGKPGQSPDRIVRWTASLLANQSDHGGMGGFETPACTCRPLPEPHHEDCPVHGLEAQPELWDEDA